MKKFLTAFFAGILPAFILILSVQTSLAGSATWKANPSSGNWNKAANWTPMTVPNGPSDTAIFDDSNQKSIFLSANTKLDKIVFNDPDASFGITTRKFTLTISGEGIMSDFAGRYFVVTGNKAGEQGVIQFTNSATAGNTISFIIEGRGMFFTQTSNAGSAGYSLIPRQGLEPPLVRFLDSSSADFGHFEIESGGTLDFTDDASAANGFLSANGGTVSGAPGGAVFFGRRANAGNAFIGNFGGRAEGSFGGLTVFADKSDASGADIWSSYGNFPGTGAVVRFDDSSHGGRARVTVFRNGSLDIRFHDAPGVTIGSLGGDGIVFLGQNNLTVGTNNLDTIFGGLIDDGASSGSLTKIGAGLLGLSNANRYDGGTTVNRGKLFVRNKRGSGTGTGPVQVNGGSLDGSGIIAGRVTIGNGRGHGALLSPGENGFSNIGTLTIRSALTFNSDATYKVQLKDFQTDRVIANGVTINSGAQFSFIIIRNSLHVGDVITIIDNTSASPIAGTFINLPDGSTFSNNGNSYQVDYQGGDGNDLTLKVVP